MRLLRRPLAALGTLLLAFNLFLPAAALAVPDLLCGPGEEGNDAVACEVLLAAAVAADSHTEPPQAGDRTVRRGDALAIAVPSEPHVHLHASYGARAPPL